VEGSPEIPSRDQRKTAECAYVRSSDVPYPCDAETLFGNAGNEVSWSSVSPSFGVIAYERIDAENCSDKESVPDVHSGSDAGLLKQTMSSATSQRRRNGRRH
jgi:hypothetical protein